MVHSQSLRRFLTLLRKCVDGRELDSMEHNLLESGKKGPATLIRNRAEAPRVLQHNLSGSYSRLHESPETVDLINILECIASEYDVRHVGGLSTIDRRPPNRDGTKLQGDDQLRQVLQKRMGLKRARDESGMQADLWPAIFERERRRRTAKAADDKEGVSGLDAQLRRLSEDGPMQQGAQPYSSNDEPILTLQQDDIVSFLPGYGVADEWVKVAQKKITSDSGSSSVSGPFRRPSRAARSLVTSRMFLLDDHCIPCKVGGRSEGRGHPGKTAAAGSSKEQLLKAACKRLPSSSSASGVSDGTGSGGVGAGGPVSGNVSSSGAAAVDAPVFESVQDVRVRAVEEIVACHAEALADAALEMVFKFVRERASSVPGHDPGAAAEEVESDDGDLDKGGDREESGPAAKKSRVGEGSAKKKATAGANRGSEETDKRAVYTWRDVVAAVHGQRGDSVKVHQSLPALPLTEAVLVRTELRLRALFGSTSIGPLEEVGPAPATETGDSSETIAAVVGRRGREVPRVLRVEPSQDAVNDTGASPGDSSDKKRKKRHKYGKLLPAAVAPHVWDK